MHHLLVPTDFSKAADRALAYAEEIARALSARLTLVHVRPPADTDPEQGTAPATQALQDLARSVGYRGIPTAAVVRRGAVVEQLVDLLATGPFTLVVMGCQGERLRPDHAWGSTTTDLIDHLRLPLLAVPAGAAVRYPHRLLFATDAIPPPTPRHLRPLLDLVAGARTELLLFHYRQATERASPDRHYARLLEGRPYRFFYQVDNRQPIGASIDAFADLIAADLLVVLHRNGDDRARSTARQLTWVSARPVLILQEDF